MLPFYVVVNPTSPCIFYSFLKFQSHRILKAYLVNTQYYCFPCIMKTTKETVFKMEKMVTAFTESCSATLWCQIVSFLVDIRLRLTRNVLELGKRRGFSRLDMRFESYISWQLQINILTTFNVRFWKCSKGFSSIYIRIFVS